MKLSVITINYNNADGLDRTIKSVVQQTWKDFEYIIIDGGSTGRDVDVIKKYESKIAYWVSEPDKGIYHAMNKGISKANGEYLLMLNSGDVLYDNTILEKVFQEDKHDYDIIYGDVYRESKGEIFTESIFPDRLTFGFLRDGAISHQAVFIRKKLHQIAGLYDERLKLCSDWSFILLAICKYNASFKHLNYKVAVCNADGFSCSPAHFRTMVTERHFVLTNQFSAFLDDYERLDKIEDGRIDRRIKKVKGRLLDKCKRVVKAALNF